MNTVNDLWEHRELLARIFKKQSMFEYLDIALGFPSSSFYVAEVNEEGRKSISTERTVGAEGVDGIIPTLTLARSVCVQLAEDIAKTPGLSGKTVTLVLKGIDFQRRSKALTVDKAVASADEMWPIVKRLVEEFQPTVGAFRLIGLRLSNFD